MNLAIHSVIIPLMITVERRPLVLGSDPTRENRLNKDGSVNSRAVWIEHTFFYQGHLKTVEIKGVPVEVRGFLDLQRDFDSDGKTVYSICTFLHSGLRNPETYEEYGNHSFGGDPIHAYRTALAMERLPKIDDPSRNWIRCSLATQQVYDNYNNKQSATIPARRGLSQIIGENQMAEILEAVPEDLEELMLKMQAGYSWVDTRNLLNDIKLGRIQPSEFYLEILRKSEQQVTDLADELGKLEESGGVW